MNHDVEINPQKILFLFIPRRVQTKRSRARNHRARVREEARSSPQRMKKTCFKLDSRMFEAGLMLAMGFPEVEKLR